MYIANPCHEKWSAMTPVEHGRLCAQCSTVVMDMTRLSNEEILALVQKTGGRCGRFYEDQLSPPEPEKGWLTQWFGGIKKDWMLASVFIMLHLNTPSEVFAETDNQEQLMSENRVTPIDSGIALPGYIQGSLLSDNGPLRYRPLDVFTKSGKKVATIKTDSLGFFAFATPDSTQEEYYIVFKTEKLKQNRFVTTWPKTKTLAKEGEWTEIKIEASRRKKIIKRHQSKKVVVGFF